MSTGDIAGSDPAKDKRSIQMGVVFEFKSFVIRKEKCMEVVLLVGLIIDLIVFVSQIPITHLHVRLIEK